MKPFQVFLFSYIPEPFVLSKLFNTKMINVKAKIHNRYDKTFSLSNVDYSEALLYQKLEFFEMSNYL